MKKILTLIIALVMLLTLAACDKSGTKCTHRDSDDNGECDACGADFEDGCDNHRDADDNEKCDECGADFEDGKEPTLIYDKSNIPTMISKKGDISSMSLS